MSSLKTNLMLFHILFLFCLLGLTGARQETIEFLHLHDTTQQLPQSHEHPISVSVSDQTLTQISQTVLKAETWLRSNVLSHYPRTKITTIVVPAYSFCQSDVEEEQNMNNNLRFVLPSLKNIHHSLTRWGLDKEIKVSPSFSCHCLNNPSDKSEVIPIFMFLQSINSTFTIDPTPNLSSFADNGLDLGDCMPKFGSLSFRQINVIKPNIKRAKPITNRRRLSYFMEKIRVIDPYPARPSPLPEISPIHPSIGFSAPATIAKNPKKTLISPLSPHNFIPPPQIPLPFPLSPSPSPFGYSLPPCAPSPYSSAGPMPFAAAPADVEAVWCVAKPSVPEETLQQALDFACGEGGADCDEIMPRGNCFYPDTVVAHASYALNSYWQKTKGRGGSCSFGGTAMLINSDPSFLHCRFPLA